MAGRPIIEYYFSFLSLWSYLGSRRLLTLSEKHNAQIIYKPVDLMHVFSVSGGVPVQQRSIQRQAYRLLEQKRWAEKRGLPVVQHPKFYPVDPSFAHRVLLAAIEERGNDDASVQEFARKSMEAVWARELDIADKGTIHMLADESSMMGTEKLLQRAEEDVTLQQQERALTEEAIEKRQFGAPIYSYRNEPFWGQDRLEMLDEVLDNGREPYELPRDGILPP